MDVLELRGLRFNSHVGYYDFEQTAGQPFVIDLKLELGFAEAALDDDLQHAVNYAELADAVEALVTTAKDRLIEHLAERIARLVLEQAPRAVAVDVTVHKPEAPLTQSFTDVAIHLHRERWSPIVLALGSNLGDRLAHLQTALKSLAANPAIAHLRWSRVYESKAWGNTQQADFLNMVLTAETSLDPFALLDLCQQLETEAKRERHEHWGPRTLDVDIIDYAGLRLRTERLQLPHPYAAERDFVRIPWRELRDGLHESCDTMRVFATLPSPSGEAAALN